MPSEKFRKLWLYSLKGILNATPHEQVDQPWYESPQKNLLFSRDQISWLLHTCFLLKGQGKVYLWFLKGSIVLILYINMRLAYEDFISNGGSAFEILPTSEAVNPSRKNIWKVHKILRRRPYHSVFIFVNRFMRSVHKILETA